MRSYDTQRTDNPTPSTPEKQPIVAHIIKQSKKQLPFGGENNNKEMHMPLFDPDEYPFNAKTIANLCGVSQRTAKRWISGRTQAPLAARRLIHLTQRERIIPDHWPTHWRINKSGALDIGFTKIALKPAQIEWYFQSCSHWYAIMALLPQIEKRLEELRKTAPTATIIELDKYRAQLRALQDRPFLLSSYR